MPFAILLLVPLLAGMDAPKAAWIGLGLIAAMGLAFCHFDGIFRSRRDAARLQETAPDKTSKPGIERPTVGHRLGVWLGRLLYQKLGLKSPEDRPPPTRKERLVATLVGTAMTAALIAAGLWFGADQKWYFVWTIAWGGSVFVTWVPRNAPRPATAEKREG